MTRREKLYNPEQIIRELRKADAMLAAGRAVARRDADYRRPG